MGGNVELGTCDVCHKQTTVNRKYYYYNIPCNCCNSKNDEHFEIVYYCSECTPKPPNKISVSFEPLSEREILNKKLKKVKIS